MFVAANLPSVNQSNHNPAQESTGKSSPPESLFYGLVESVSPSKILNLKIQHLAFSPLQHLTTLLFLYYNHCLPYWFAKDINSQCPQFIHVDTYSRIFCIK